MLVGVIRCLLLLIIASPMFGAAGDGTRSFTNLVFGPVVFLVAALGILSCLYQFARGNKSAAFFILGGLLFLGVARALLKGWLDPSSGAGFAMNMGKFPVYGEAEAADAGGKHFYGFVASWAYIGLTISHALSMATLALGIPVLIAIVGALVTYWKITTKQQAGSVIGYFISVILVAVFCIFPSVSFVPPPESDVPQDDVIKSIIGINSGIPRPSSDSPELLTIPLLPALILSAGTDMTQAIGNVINPDPGSMYVAQMVRAARSSALPDGWETEYEDFAVHCAAAYKGFVSAEPETAKTTVNFIKNRLAEGRLGRVPASSLNLLSNWGDSIFAFVPLHGYVVNDENDDLAYTAAMRRVNEGMTPAQIAINSAKTFWITPNIATGSRESSVFSLNLNPGFNPGSHLVLPYIQYNNFGKTIFTYPESLVMGAMGKLIKPKDIDNLEIPYCSIPRGTKHPKFLSPPASMSLFVTIGTEKSVTGYGSVGDLEPGMNGGLVLDFKSAYLESIATNKKNTGPFQFYPFDWSDRIRYDLINSFSGAVCHSACGNPSNKFYWGCMVSGLFIALSGDEACKSSAEVTQAFYGIIPINKRTATGFSFAQAISLSFYPPVKPRSDVDGLRDGPGAGTDPSTWEMPMLRSVVDLIMAAPGNGVQHSMARDIFTVQGSNDPTGLYGFLSGIPKLGMWILSSVASMAVEIVSFLWPHFMGLNILAFLVVYPIFGMLALWPGKWVVLLDWIRGAIWVLLWAPIVSLGFSFINGGAFVNNAASFLSPHDGPGSSLLQLVGICLIFAAPAVAQAVISPGIDGLSRLGASIYGQGFRATGLGSQLGTLIGGFGGGLLAGSAMGGGLLGGNGGGGGTGSGHYAQGAAILPHRHSIVRNPGFISEQAGAQGGPAASAGERSSSSISGKSSAPSLAAASRSFAPENDSPADAAPSTGQPGFANGIAVAPADARRMSAINDILPSRDGRSPEASPGSAGDAEGYRNRVSRFQRARAAGNDGQAGLEANAIASTSQDAAREDLIAKKPLEAVQDFRHAGDAMSHVASKGDPDSMRVAQQFYSQGSRLADEVLRRDEFSLSQPERENLGRMRDILGAKAGAARVGLAKGEKAFAQEEYARKSAGVTDGKELEQLGMERDRAVNKQDGEIRAGQRVVDDASSNLRGTLAKSYQNLQGFAQQDAGGNGLGFRSLLAGAAGALEVEGALQELGGNRNDCGEADDPNNPMRKVAEQASPSTREILFAMKGASMGDNEMVAQHLQNADKLGSIGGGTAALGELMTRATEGVSGQALSPQDISQEILNLNNKWKITSDT